MSNIPDSEWLAPMVIEAYTDRRYELAAALAKLQLQAHRMDQAEQRAIASAPVPFYNDVYAHAVTEEPVSPPAEPAEQPPPSGCLNSYGSEVPWGHPSCAVLAHEDPHIPKSEADWVYRPAETPQESAQPDTEDAPTAITPSARCVTLVGPQGQQRECHGVLFWVQPITTDDGHWSGGWQHLDPKQFGDHEPKADRSPDQ